MAQALEHDYNKPAKGAGGIIGLTRRKEAIALWNITKHEKENYTNTLRIQSHSDALEGESTLHRHFSKSSKLLGCCLNH